MGDRTWKACICRIKGGSIYCYQDRKESKSFQEIQLLPSYSLSDVVLQQYDIYGKIHTVKLQHVAYKERVGLRPGQIPKLVEGQFTRLGLPLEHAASITELAKFGCLNAEHMSSFVHSIEDCLFTFPLRRESPVTYKQDEIQIHCVDESMAEVDKLGVVSNQQARVRLFMLAFVTGMPLVEIGLNDRRRQGKEVVRRKDILPMYTDRWIRYEALEFHSAVDKAAFDKEHTIKLVVLVLFSDKKSYLITLTHFIT